MSLLTSSNVWEASIEDHVYRRDTPGGFRAFHPVRYKVPEGSDIRQKFGIDVLRVYFFVKVVALKTLPRK